jgi:hypothetical protein
MGNLSSAFSMGLQTVESAERKTIIPMVVIM